MIWDLIIVGGGPAGSLAALARLSAAPESKVLIIDKAEFPREKACGDAVAAPAAMLLRSLDLDPRSVFRGAVTTRNLELRGPGTTVVHRPLADATYVMKRSVLDHRLLSAAQSAGAEFEIGRVKSLLSHSSGLLVGEHQARTVIGADGSESTVRRLVSDNRRKTPRMAVAIRGYSLAPATLADKHIIAMTGKAWPSYAWSFPAADGLVNAGYGELLDLRAPVSRQWLLDELMRLVPELDAPVTELRAARLALAPRRAFVSDGPVLLAGDSLALVNPITGEGIFHAMISGALAGLASLSGEGAGATYRALLKQKVGRHFRDLYLLSHLHNSPATLEIVLRRAKASQAVFDGLVDLGLQNGAISSRWLARIFLLPAKDSA